MASSIEDPIRPSPRRLQMFVTELQAAGLTREQIDTRGREVPGALSRG